MNITTIKISRACCKKIIIMTTEIIKDLTEKGTIFIDCSATLKVDKLQASPPMNYLGFQTHAINSVLRLGVLNQQRIVVLLQEVGREKETKKIPRQIVKKNEGWRNGGYKSAATLKGS